MCKGKKGVPKNKVQVTCRVCHSVYLISHNELRQKANANNGWYPCNKCGSHATSWKFGRDEY